MKKIIVYMTVVSLLMPVFVLAQDNTSGTSVGTTPPPAASLGTTPAPQTSNGTTPAPKTSTGSTPAECALCTLPNPLKVNSLSDLFYSIVNFVISLSYVVIAFFLLLSGFKFVTAQGSEDKLSDAKRMFFNTVIGALIIIGANTIVAVVKSVIENLQK